MAYDGMSQLSGKAIVAYYNFSVNYNTAAHTGTQGNGNKVFHVFGAAINHFAHSGGIGIIGKLGRQSKFLAYQVGYGYNAFPFKIGSIFNSARINITVRRTHTNS